MKILNRFTYKNLIKNKKRTIVTIVGTVLATSLLFLVGLLFASIREQEIYNSINNTGDYHALISNPTNDSEIDKIIKNNSNIKNYISIDYIEDEVLNASFDYEDNFTLKEGVLPTNINEIIISYDDYKDNNYQLNQVITFDSNSYTIVGVYIKSNFDHYEYEDGILKHLDYYTKTEIDNYPTDFYLYYNNINDTVNNTYEIAKECNYSIESNTSINKYENIKINTEYLKWFGIGDVEYQQRIRTIFFVILLLLALFSSLAIYNAFAISTSERKKTFGIFRSIGASKTNIFMSVLFEAFIISIISIPLGFILSLGILSIGSSIIERLFQNISLTYNLEIVFYKEYLIISIIFCLFMIFLSALIPAFKSCRISPLDALKLNNEHKIKKKKSKLKIGLLGIEKALAKKNIERDSKKYRSAKISIIISIILVMTFGTIINSFIDPLKNNIDYEYPINMSIKSSVNSSNIIKEIIELEEVDKYLVTRLNTNYSISINDNFTNEYISYRGLNNEYANVMLISYDDYNYNKLKEKYNISEDVIFVNKNYIIESNDAYVDNTIVTKYNDNITSIKLYKDEEKEPFYELNNIYLIDDLDYKDPYIVMNDIELSNILSSSKDEENYLIYIDSDDYKELDKKILSLKDEYQEIESYSNILTENYEYINNIKIIIYAIYTFMGFICIIAACNIINTISTNISLRRKELAVLRSIGLSNQEFNKMIMYEGLILGFDSLIYGHLLSLIFYFLIMFSNIFSEEIIPYPINFLIITIIGTYLIIFITLYLSIRKIKKANIIDVIREDNI